MLPLQPGGPAKASGAEVCRDSELCRGKPWSVPWDRQQGSWEKLGTLGAPCRQVGDEVPQIILPLRTIRLMLTFQLDT